MMRNALALLLFGLATTAAAQSVTVTLPPSISFFVNDVSSPTIGTPAPVSVSYSGASIPAGQVLRFSVIADAPAFTPPSGTGIPVARVSWSDANATGGVGANGTLSSTTYGLVFQSTTSPSSGNVDVTFTLAPPAVPIVSGAHTLTMRWKIESF